MSLETSIDNLTAAIREFTALAKPATVSATTAVPALPPVETVAPTPVKPRQTRAAKPAPEPQPPAPVLQTPAAAPADDGGFLDEPAAPAYTQDNVRAALVAYQKAANSQEKAREVLKVYGKSDTLTALKAENYGAVIEEAQKRTASIVAAQ